MLHWILLLSLACRNKDEPVDTANYDLDEDGFTVDEGDCNDEDPSIHPDAEEVCDGQDNNCDESIDEGVTQTFWADADEDGFGNAEAPAELCELLEGFSELDTDCDDDDPEVNPDATEACNGVDDNCNGEVDEAGDELWYADADEDGYGDATISIDTCDPEGSWVLDATDCDDEDASVNPGMDDICNLADDDCDGEVDEDPEFTWYMDNDGDGHGSTVEVDACSQPEGTSAISGDCDDADEAVNPDADEVCDGLDNDCDGTSDNDDAIDAPSWYTDGDGDGYGDTSNTTTSCTQPSGLVGDGDDCDDGDSAINPDATETCDGIDNDCSGTVDDDYASDADTWYADSDGDGYGDADVTTTACSQPSGYVDDTQDCDDSNSAINPDAEEVCTDGVDDDCDGTADDECPIEHCGTISSSETWSNTDEHLVTCDVYVQGSGKPTLTVGDGTTVYFEAGTNLIVGWGSYGKLDVNGTTSSGVTFTSDESSPAEGDWDGLIVGYYDQGSSLEGLTLEYGGGNGTAGLYVYYAELEITDSTFQYNENHGAYVTGAEVLVQDSSFSDNTATGLFLTTSAALDSSGNTPTFTGNTLTGNGDHPMALPANDLGELDASTSTFSGNTEDSVLVQADTVNVDATWQAIDVPLLFEGTVYIQGSSRPVVTVEDGLEATFDNNVNLYVGWSSYGSIEIEGTSTGVTFTSAESSPAAGDWGGLNIGYYDQGSLIEGLDLSYAGDNTVGCLYVYYADLEIIDSSVHDCDNNGLYATGSPELLITGSDFSDNDGNGITLTAYVELDDSSTPSFIDNTMTGNGDYPLTIAANELGQLDSSSTFSGNAKDFIEVTADYVTDDATWQGLDVPFLVTGDIYIQGSGRPEVEIEDGASFVFDGGAGLVAGSGNYATLTVSGSTSGVSFSSSEASPAAGDWDGIVIGYYAEDSTMAGFTIEYGGGNGVAGLYLYYTSMELSDCTVADNDVDGIYVTGAGADISDCSLSDNANMGLQLSSSGELDGSFDNNTVSGNGDYPILLPANSIGQLDSSSSYTGNGTDAIWVFADTVTADATWQALDVNYFIDGDIYVQGTARPHVTIEDGTTFEMDAALYVGWSSYGSVEVNGTSSGVTFTSAESSPAAGDWAGISIGYYCDDSQVDLDGVTVEYGGANGYGNIRWYYCDGSIDNSTLSDSSSYGQYRQGASPTIGTITYSNNASGDLY